MTKMKASLSISIALTLAACGGSSTTPTASGVFPSQGFTGRTLRVEVSGDATSWKDGATVSFGDNVTVNNVMVASPTDLFAEITVDPNAAVGMRDVTVSSGGTFTLKQAFELVGPVQVQLTGTVAQGSIVKFTIVNHDFDNPFDTTTASDPQTGATTYPNLTITGPAGMDFMSPIVSQSFNVAPYEITGLALVDVDAAASGSVTITSGAMMPVTSVSAPVMVAARPPTPMTPGVQVSGMIAKSGDSQLYQLPAAPSAPELIRIDNGTRAAAAARFLTVVLGATGHWKDILAVGAPGHGISVTGGMSYVIATDLSGASGYTYSITGHVDHLLLTNEPTTTPDHNTPATAVAEATVPFFVNMATMTGTAATDDDYFTFTTGAGDAGKHFHVTTLDGPDPFTDVAVDVLDAQQQSISGGPHSGGQGCGLFSPCGADFDTGAVAASTKYYFRVSAGGGFMATDDKYVLLVWMF